MTSASVKMNQQGRVSLVADIRNELGYTTDTELVEYIDDGRVVIESRENLMRRIQRDATRADTGSESVTDELIADRRAEAERERAETESIA